MLSPTGRVGRVRMPARAIWAIAWMRVQEMPPIDRAMLPTVHQSRQSRSQAHRRWRRGPTTVRANRAPSATCSPAGVKRWLPSEADRAWEAGNGVVHVPPLNALARYHTAAAVAAGGVEVAVAAAVGDRVSSYSDFRR